MQATTNSLADILNQRKRPDSKSIVKTGVNGFAETIRMINENLNEVFFEGRYFIQNKTNVGNSFHMEDNGIGILIGRAFSDNEERLEKSEGLKVKYSGDSFNVYMESARRVDNDIREKIISTFLNTAGVGESDIIPEDFVNNDLARKIVIEEPWRLRIIESAIDTALYPSYVLTSLATPDSQYPDSNFTNAVRALTNNINKGIRDTTMMFGNKAVDKEKKYVTFMESGLYNESGELIDPSMYAMEGFDPQYLGNMGKLTITLAFGVCGNDKLTDALFPIFPIQATQKGFDIEVPVMSFINNYTRRPNGDPVTDQDLNKIPIYKCIFNEDVWTVNFLEIDPVVKGQSVAGKAGISTDDKLFTAAAYESNVGGNWHTSAPLLVGKKVGYLGLCSSSVGVGTTFDQFDTLERAPELKAVYFKIGSGSDAEYFRLNLNASQLGTGTVDMPNANTKEQMIRFVDRTYSIYLNEDLKQVNTGEDRLPHDSSTHFKASELFSKLGLTSGASYSVRLGLNVNVSFDMNTSNLRVGDDSDSVVVEGILDNKTRRLLSTDHPDYKKIMDYFTGDETRIKLYAVILKAQVTNSNQRILGNTVTIDVYRTSITVPFSSGFTVQGPHENMHYRGDDSDIKNLPDLITLINQKIFHEQYQTLFNYQESLREICKFSANSTIPQSSLGIGFHYLNPYYREYDLDVPTMVDSIRTSERMEDIRSAMFNFIRREVITMMLQSNYWIAMRLLSNNQQQKATLVLATDIFTGAVLAGTDVNAWSETQLIPFTMDIDLKIVTSPHDRMRNKILAMFCDLNGDRHNTINPLQFGYTFYTAPIVYAGVNQIGTTSVRYINSVGRFKSIIQTPVMAVFNVKNLTHAFGKQEFFVNSDVKQIKGYEDKDSNFKVWDVMSGAKEVYSAGAAMEESLVNIAEIQDKANSMIHTSKSPNLSDYQQKGLTQTEYRSNMNKAKAGGASPASPAAPAAASEDSED